MSDSQSLGLRVAEGALAVITLIVVVVFLAVVEFDPTSTTHVGGQLAPIVLLSGLVLIGAVLDGYSPATLGVGVISGLTLAVAIWTGLGLLSPEEGVFFDGILAQAFAAVLAIVVIVRAALAVAAAGSDDNTGGDPLGDY